MNIELILIVGFCALGALCVAILLLHGKKKRESIDLRLELSAQFQILTNMMMETLSGVSSANNRSVEILRHTVEQKLSDIERSVDQKLNHTLKTGLDSSFARVSEQLRMVYQSMGEMRSLTAGIGDLKSILSNVKTRGIWGEMQLYQILSDFLAPQQYRENAKIGTDGYVEFAVLLPKEESSDHVLLPIDAKFPMDRYVSMMDQMQQGADAQSAQKELAIALVAEARKISEKYIKPPQTTDFAILFLPSEGLYAEAVRMGLLDKLQSRFRVMLTGPATLCAFLTSLQTGFRTLEIRKHSTLVMDLLHAVKTELDAFAQSVQKTRNSLNAAQNHLDTVQKKAARISTRLSDLGAPDAQQGDSPHEF